MTNIGGGPPLIGNLISLIGPTGRSEPSPGTQIIKFFLHGSVNSNKKVRFEAGFLSKKTKCTSVMKTERHSTL